jgi:hypothetical protein
MRCPAIPETPVVKAAVAAICTYETAAIISGFVPPMPTLPTITALTKRWPAIGVALVGALAIHFWVPTPDALP